MVKSESGISIISFLLLYLSTVGLYAQNVDVGGLEFSDCRNLMIVTHERYVMKAPKGYGKELEVKGHKLGSPYYIEQEHHTIWYRIDIEEDGEFYFIMEGETDKEDWDFMLFKAAPHAVCENLPHKPVRANMARNGPVQGRFTGLKPGAVDEYVPAGVQPVYGAPVQVKKGEVYVLLTDEVRGSGGGHTITFHLPEPAPAKTDTPEVHLEDTVKAPLPKPNSLLINLYDQITKDSIQGRISVKFTEDSIIKKDHLHQLQLNVLPETAIEVTSFAPGFLFNTVKFKMPASKDEERLKIYLKPIRKGGRINLTDIRFKGNKAEILPSSGQSLDNLLKFLEVNENLKVEIQGHVNGPNERNTKWFKKLSKDRAAAIKNFLIDGGIDKKRLKSKGYGNKHMIYANPKNDAQSSANRRVEIKILGIKN